MGGSAVSAPRLPTHAGWPRPIAQELQSMRILAETERLEDQLLALQRNQWYNRLLATSVDDEV